jgi:hypothetical protein
MRIAFASVKKSKRGAWIIAWGAICCLVFFLFFLLDGIFSRDLLRLGTFRVMLYVISVLSIPVATSIYLGLDFAFINRKLKKKLAEVEDLSQKLFPRKKKSRKFFHRKRKRSKNRYRNVRLR